jgi:outer membrane protein assembly factor BamB
LKFSSSKTTATLVALFLMLTIAISLMTVPTANAQALIMNLPGAEGVPHNTLIHIENYDIDLNGGPGADQEVALFVKYPGRADFTLIDIYTTRSNGDLDVYDFDFNETGDFELKWALPPDFTEESNVEIVRVFTIDTYPPGHVPAWEIPTYAKISFSANPIGVGQTTLIYMFLGNPPFFDAALSNNYRYHNFILTITAPDDTVQTQTFEYISDPTGAQTYLFTPDQVGTYTVNFTFPGMAIKDYPHNPVSDFRGDTYLPSSTSKTLTVQEEPLPAPITSYPLPTEYWTRPIYGENNDWWSISSNWLGSGAPGYGDSVGPDTKVFPGDAIGSNTAHIMWTKPLQPGGVVGGNNFEIQGNTYFEGSAYNQRFQNPIIVYGRIYYRTPLSFTGSNSGPTYCVDLRTGEVIWSRTDLPSIRFAYIYDVEDPQQHGVYPAVLCTNNFGQCFDADTGEPLFEVTGVPSGTTVLGPQGEHLRYVMANAGTRSNPDYHLMQWNSSRLFTGMGFGSGTGLSPSISGTVDASEDIRYDWSVSIPWRNTMSSNPSVVAAFYNNMMILRNGSLPSTNSDPSIQNPYTYFAVNLDPSKGAVGSALWWNTVTPPPGIQIISNGGADPTAGVFVESYRQTSNWVGYSMENGAKIWGPTASQEDLDYYGSTGPGTLANVVAYGKLYSSAYAGILYAYDLETGDLLWTYGNGEEGNSTFGGLGVYYNHYPTFINAIGNGIIHLVTTEHTVETPIYKGALVRAVNATDGTEIWTLSAYVGEFGAESFAIADGFDVFFNGYDNQIYSVGKGPSETTVSIQNDVTTHGNEVLVKGSVMDISAGTKQNEQAARFPKGVPVVSDESMMEWMGYVYQQKPRPTDVKGVEVVISVLDPNTNCYKVARATSDENGMFRVAFTPEVPGEYSVYASFEGSEGYWPSQAETAIKVEEAPTATPEPTPVPQEPVGTYFTISTIAIIVAIAIAVLLLLRKR